MDYVRTERKPFLLEAMVSRLYGHSSASGANFVTDEVDCLARFEKKLEERKHPHARRDGRAARDATRRSSSRRASACARSRSPTGETIWEHVFAERRHRRSRANGAAEERSS